MRFRYDIGLLRAFAVLAVLFYHFKVPYFQGGYLGVDVFFVISGYLMSNIIFKGINNQSFNYFEFVKKRAVRIIPALLVVSLFILIVTPILFFGQQVQTNAEYVLSSITFVSNFHYWLNQNYFDAGAQYNIFIHSWSLSVEWQFYLLFPLFILILRSLTGNREKVFRTLYIFVTVFSFVLCLYASLHYATFNFYMIPTRAWEMLMGGIVIFVSNPLQRFIGKYSNLVVALSLCSLVLMLVTFDESIPWPSAYTVLPTLAAFLILAIHPQQAWMQNKLIQFIGNISYSLYLWHWPLFVIVNSYQLTSTYYLFLAFLLSFLFAMISYYYIEKNERIANLKGLTIGFITLLAFGLFSVKKPENVGFKAVRILEENYRPYFEYDQLEQFNACNCFLTDGPDYQSYNFDRCLKIDTARENILLIGDSHAAQFSKSMRTTIEPDRNFLEVSAGFAFPFINAKGNQESVDLLKQVFKEFIPTNKQQIKKVFISVHWLMQKRLDYSDQELQAGIKELVSYLERQQLDYYFIGQSESYTAGFNKICLGMKISKDVNLEQYLDVRSAQYNELLKSLIPQKRYIDIYLLLRNSRTDAKNNMPYMFDANHFTEYGADQIVAFLKANDYL